MDGKAKFVMIDNDLREVPSLFVNRSSYSNVVKKSEMVAFKNANELLLYVKKVISDRQDQLNRIVRKMIEDKEEELNHFIERRLEQAVQEFEMERSEWFEYAQKKLNEIIDREAMNVIKIKDEIKAVVVDSVKRAMQNYGTNEQLISILSEQMLSEVDEHTNDLKVRKEFYDEYVKLLLESDDFVLTIDTKNLIEDLQDAL